MEVDERSIAPRRTWYFTVLGAVLALCGLYLAVGGIWLLSLGGSAYYLIVGIVLTASGVMTARARMAGAGLFGVAFFGTVAWAFWEVGLQFWPLVPRLAPMLVMAIVMLLLLPRLSLGRIRGPAYAGVAVIALVLVAGGFAVFSPHGVIRPEGSPARIAVAGESNSVWQYFARTLDGTRYAPYTQITPDNVGNLKVAWTTRTGDMTAKGVESQNTPLQIGDTLYACTPRDQVLALDADTGKIRWKYDSGIRETHYSRCRGVGYYDASLAMQNANHTGGTLPVPSSATAPAPAPLCERRIILTTTNAKMVALDAATGKLCTDFGDHGIVDLHEQIGKADPSFYFQTSAPTVVHNLVVVGSFVMDGRAEQMPGGVVRAFDVTSGKLVWAFDAGHPNSTTPPRPGENFTPSTPNMWSTPAFDDKLGMIYLPIGGGSDDFWGANRSKQTEAYGDTILALDIATGHERWKFQTVHHDLWDYDVAPQPALFDVSDGHGGTIPAIIQATKTGQIFMLDSRSGKAIAAVQERRVPQGGQPGDRTSPTQPYSVGMPQIGATGLTESDMWGATFFDQLACRIKFRQARYEGPYTPITTKPTIFYPGYYGGMNWGGVSIDHARGLMILNDIRMPQVITLVPRDKVDPKEISDAHSLGLYPQTGGPYATRHATLMSFLGIPCNVPPWGTMTAVDLKTRKVVWQRPMGTIKDSVLPIGLKSPLPIPVGMPTLGGPMSTAAGLTFYSGTQDYYLRALDTQTGDELWKGRLPVGTQSTPMTYISPKTGKQYIIVSAGGARLSPDHGDYVIAYALPDRH